MYPDGLGNIKNVPDRIDFDPFPWHSMAVWILTQMKRWGYVEQRRRLQESGRAGLSRADCREVMKALGYKAPAQDSTKHHVYLMARIRSSIR